MTTRETAATLRSLADAIDKLPGGGDLPISKGGGLSEEQAVGAAAFLCYLRDCIQSSPKETWSREELLVLLECTSRDPDIFMANIGVLMWAAEDE
jgi:hypothetical protein